MPSLLGAGNGASYGTYDSAFMGLGTYRLSQGRISLSEGATYGQWAC